MPKYSLKYKTKKGRSKREFYHIEIPNITVSQSANSERTHYQRLVLFQNQTDGTDNFVAIKFYLPEPSEVKLILIDSDGKEQISFIQKRFDAGCHTYVTDLRNDELEVFDYYYKLQTESHSEIKQMKYKNNFTVEQADC